MTDDLRARTRASVKHAAVVAGVFAIASLIAAVIWNVSTDLPRWQRSGQSISMGPIEATKTIGIDAVYLIVSVPIAMAVGAALMYWLRRTPVTTVALIALAAICAAALMERFGLMIGPSSPADVLRNAAAGATAPVRLQIQASGVVLAWPGGALLGALLVLLIAPAPPVERVDLPAEAADSDRLNELPTV